MNQYEHLNIVYADPANQFDELLVSFKLRNHCFINCWLERLLTAQQQNCPIDDPFRFYGFNTNESEIAVSKLNNCIDIINSYQNIIKRHVSIPINYDTLNYLHSIFETYHGLLDKQDHDFFQNAPVAVKKALSDLNILIHRCESCLRGIKPRQVVTYFGLQKSKKLLSEHYSLITDEYKFGTVYLNYVEIGKTLEELAMDNDQYISDQAFQPYQHYSADFVIIFHDSDMDAVIEKRQKMREFYNNHLDFFSNRNLKFDNPILKPGRIPLADIISHDQELIELLKTKQFVKSVSVS